MSRWHGKMGKGASRLIKEEKRAEAQERQVQEIPCDRTKVHRRAIEQGFSCPGCEA